MARFSSFSFCISKRCRGADSTCYISLPFRQVEPEFLGAISKTGRFYQVQITSAFFRVRESSCALNGRGPAWRAPFSETTGEFSTRRLSFFWPYLPRHLAVRAVRANWLPTKAFPIRLDTYALPPREAFPPSKGFPRPFPRSIPRCLAICVLRRSLSLKEAFPLSFETVGNVRFEVDCW